MKPNVGGLDRVIRIICGLALFILGAFIIKPMGLLAIVMIIIGSLMFLSGLFRYCPPYALLGINTCSKKPEPQAQK
jgi:hypothetical protein